MPTIPNTADPPKARRRWLQFRLRTLLIGVVVIGTACGYVAHEASIVAARRAWIDSHPRVWRIADWDGPVENKVPLIRRCLGDHHICQVELSQPTLAEMNEAWRLFPEATGMLVDGQIPPDR